MAAIRKGRSAVKVGVISDTHGNLAGLIEAYDRLRSDHDVAKIFFLGHACSDLDRLIEVKEALGKAKARRQGDDDTMGEGLLGGALLSEALAGRATPKAPAPRSKLDELEWLRRNVVRVAAADDPELASGSAAESDFEMVGGRFVCAVHDPRRLGKDDIASASIVLYGQTHLAQVDKVGGRYFLNPGHLMGVPDQGRPPSFGVLDLGDEPAFRIYDLDGGLLQNTPLDLEVKRKFSIS